MHLARRALLTFAFVSEALKAHQNILVGIAPLFKPIAADLNGQIFVPQLLRDELERRYGITISTDVAEFMSFALQRAGLLRRKDVGSADVAFFWTAQPNLADHDRDLEIKIDQLGAAAIEFSQESPSLLSWNITLDDALNLLFDWLIEQDNDLRNAEQLFDGANVNAQALASPRKIAAEKQYFCSRFVNWLATKNPELYDIISEIRNALLLSEVVFELREPSVSAKVGRELFVYLDGPICMDYLGCSGKARKEDALYIADRFKALGAIICIFSHSVDEIKENLKAVLSRPSGERTGPTAAAILAGEVPEDFLWSVLRNTESYIAQAGINTFDAEKTQIAPSQIQAFTDEYEDQLLSRLQPHYSRLEAAGRDAASIALIMRRRARSKSNDLFKTKHIMITRNPMVAAIAKNYCSHLGLLAKEQLGPLIHVRLAAALLWLAVGSQQKKEISRRQLVVSCSRALEASPEVIQQIRKKLAEIKPENAAAFDALIKEPRNVQIAMDFAQGSESRVLEYDPELILDKMLKELTATERDRQKAEIKELQQKHRASQEKLKGQISSLKKDIDEALQREIIAVIRLFERACLRNFYLAVIFKSVGALLVFVLVLITSSVLLERVDKLWFHYWTILLSVAVAFLAAIPVLFDVRKFIWVSVIEWRELVFTSRLNLFGLLEASKYVKLDWEQSRYILLQEADQFSSTDDSEMIEAIGDSSLDENVRRFARYRERVRRVVRAWS